MMNWKLASLKKKAKSLYLKIRREEDKYSCGKKLAEYISPDIHALKEEFNEVWDQIMQLDPGAPVSPFAKGR